MKRVLLIILSFACSCSGPTEKSTDPLTKFPVNSEWEFISGLGKDRIIMMLRGTEENKFTYRIELMKNYYGLPLDYGSLTLAQMEPDSSFNFVGGNEECKLKLKMFQSK